MLLSVGVDLADGAGNTARRSGSLLTAASSARRAGRIASLLLASLLLASRIAAAARLIASCGQNTALPPGRCAPEFGKFPQFAEFDDVLPLRHCPGRLAPRSDDDLGGALEPLSEGSTKLVVSTVTHAGICKVERYHFAFVDPDSFQWIVR